MLVTATFDLNSPFTLLLDESKNICVEFLKIKEQLYSNPIVNKSWEMFPFVLFSQETECNSNLKYFPAISKFIKSLKGTINFLAISVVLPSDLELPHTEDYDTSYHRYHLPLQLPTTAQSYLWNNGEKTYHTMGEWSEMINTNTPHYPLNPAINTEDRVVLIVDVMEGSLDVNKKANKVLGKMREDLSKYVPS